MPESTELQRLARIEATLEVVSNQLKDVLKVVQEYGERFQEHLQATAVHTDRLTRVETGLSKHSEEFYGTGQMVAKVQELERFRKEVSDAQVVAKVREFDTFKTNFNRIIWEIAKPALTMMGIGLVLLLGILGVFLYSFQAVITKLLAP